MTSASASGGTAPRVVAQTPPRVDENVAGSRLMAAMSAALVNDQKPGSSPVSAFQCGLACERMRAKSSYGGPSSKYERSVRSTLGRSTSANFDVVVMTVLSSVVHQGLFRQRRFSVGDKRFRHCFAGTKSRAAASR